MQHVVFPLSDHSKSAMENTDNPRSTYFFDQAVPVFFWPKKPKPLLFFLGLNIIMVFLLGLILFVSVVSAAPSDPQAKPSTSIDLLTAAPTPVGSFFGFDTPTDPLPGDGTALDPYSRAGIQAKADTLAWQSCNNPGGLNVNCPFTQCTGRCPCFDFCRDGSCPGRDNSRVICVSSYHGSCQEGQPRSASKNDC